MAADDGGRMRSVRTLLQIRATLREYVERDPEQEVTGMAIPTTHAVVKEARGFIDEDDPVLDEIADVISPETVGSGSVRCADLLLVVDTILPRISKPVGPKTFRP